MTWLDVANDRADFGYNLVPPTAESAAWMRRLAAELASDSAEAAAVRRWLAVNPMNVRGAGQSCVDYSSLESRLLHLWEFLSEAVASVDEQARDRLTAAAMAESYESVACAALEFAKAIDRVALKGLRLPPLCRLFGDDDAASLLRALSRASAPSRDSRDTPDIDDLLAETAYHREKKECAPASSTDQLPDWEARRRYDYAQYVILYAPSSSPNSAPKGENTFLLADMADLSRAYAGFVRLKLANIDRATNLKRLREQSTEAAKRTKGEAEKLEAERLEKIHLVDIRARMIAGRVIDFFCRAFDTAAIPHTVIAACVRLTVRACYDQDRPDMDRNYVQKIYETKKRARRSPATGRGRKKVNRSE